MSNLEKKLKNLPAKPGVYFFKNKSGEIIYIGKSGHLKNRIRSYFNNRTKFFNAAKLKMLDEIADIQIMEADSEIAALIKESELIKKHKPKFNVLMRDSKNYFFVGFTKEDFPKIIPTHQKIRAPGYRIRDYIGPFTDAGAVRKSLRLLRNIFPYCTCRQKHSVKCLNAHLGKCLGFCCLKNHKKQEKEHGAVSVYRVHDRVLGIRKQYQGNIKALRTIMSGHGRAVLNTLKKEIKQLIKNQNFEKANEIKKQIAELEGVLAHAKVLTKEPPELSPAIFPDTQPDFRLLGFKKNPRRIETYDISNIQGREAVGSMVVFMRQPDGAFTPDKNEYRKFRIKTVAGINDTAMMAELIRRRFKNSWPQPQLIVVDGGRGQLNAALKALGSRKIKIVSLAKRLEEIYLPNRKGPVPSQNFGQSLKRLFQAIRDEAHRFAIGYHRKLHQKSLLGLDRIT